jgi:hypothetical protein
MPAVLATWEEKIGRIEVLGQPTQILYDNPITKITRAKWTGGMVQVVQYLFCKQEP